MGAQLLKAEYQGILKIADKELSCAVLEDGTRVISYSAVFQAFGRIKGGKKKDKSRVPDMPNFIDANNLQPYVSDDLRSALNQIEYVNINGSIATGYRAEILPLLCDVYLQAREQKALVPSQQPLAVVSELLVRSLSKIGIIALVDEATGYQEVRNRDALQAILDKYLRKEFAAWAKRFPDEFYKEIFRLKGWAFNPKSIKRPSVIGKYTNDIVYERLAPGVLDELRNRNPILDTGHRKVRHHQYLTEDIGNPALAQHLFAVIALMRASSNWDGFYRLLQRSFPKYGDQLRFDILLDE